MNRLRTGCSWGGEELSWHIYRNWFFVTWQVNSFHFNPEKQKNSPHPQDSHQIAKWHTYFRHVYNKVYLHCYIANYVRWFPVHHRLKREGRSFVFTLSFSPLEWLGPSAAFLPADRCLLSCSSNCSVGHDGPSSGTLPILPGAAVAACCRLPW